MNTKDQKTKKQKKKSAINDNEMFMNDDYDWNSLNRKNNKDHAKVLNNKNPKTDNSTDNFYNKLSNKFVEQQDQVKVFRLVLLWWFTITTAIQLIVINVIIIMSIFCTVEPINDILKFLEFFIGATFIELLGGLFIIVKFVFNHETFDMLKHLTYKSPSQEQTQDCV